MFFKQIIVSEELKVSEFLNTGKTLKHSILMWQECSADDLLNLKCILIKPEIIGWTQVVS